MKKELSLVQETLLLNTLYGIFWIIYGVLQMFDHVVVNFIASVFLFVPMLMRIIYIRKNGLGMSDEMSERNMMKAKSETLEILTFMAILLFVFREIFGFVATLPYIQFSIVSACAFVVGIKEVLVGILFAKYEKEGE